MPWELGGLRAWPHVDARVRRECSGAPWFPVNAGHSGIEGTFGLLGRIEPARVSGTGPSFLVVAVSLSNWTPRLNSFQVFTCFEAGRRLARLTAGPTTLGVDFRVEGDRRDAMPRYR